MSYDLVVIGAGSGGVRAARMAAGFGARVAIVESRFFGGTCVNVGCVPKKLFAYASEFPGDLALAADFGFSVPAPRVDWPTLRANKDREIARLNGIYRKLLDGAGVEVFEGHATVSGADQVEVNGEVLLTKRILIATGGRPFVPDVPGRELLRISDDLFYLDELPETVAVVGGGYIACEFASILHGLGCRVHLLYRRELFLRGFDREIREFVARDMARRGIELHFNTDLEQVSDTGSGRRLDFVGEGGLDVDEVFCATGRVPNVDNLFAEGFEVNQKPGGAIAVDERYQSSVPGVYAIGDVTDRIQLTPVALEEGMWLARDLFTQQNPDPVSYEMVPSAVFCHPNIATIGLTEEEALERRGTLRVYRSEFRPMRHTLGESEARSLMKLIVEDDNDQVVGLHMAGEEAAEIVQGFAVALQMGATKADFDRTIGIHPTSAEEFVTMRDGKVVRDGAPSGR